MKEMIYPKSLKVGDKIAIISPAGSVEESQLKKGLELIEAKGFEPVLGNHIFTKYSHGYGYAGNEKERLEDINWAFNDENISAVWASRGGYGCQHLIRHLKLTEFKKNPKWFIGYSDNTVIQSYLLKNGFVSINGQTIKTSSFGVTDESYDWTFDLLQGKYHEYEVEKNEYNKQGKAEGILVGGNLALVYALLGTRYSFNFKDKILFIEEIGEKYYALDRMLMSLDLAGVFQDIGGLIIGGMTNMGEEDDNENYEESYDEFSHQIISERISKYNFPTLYGFPNGHILDNRPLIIGAKVRLEVGKENIVKYVKS